MIAAASTGARGARLAAAVAAVVAAAAVAVPFVTATTFIGDDHLFLAFSRYAPNPLVAFVRDQHGGEFYRPWPMLVWWGLGRVAAGSSLPFAALGLALHAGAAALLGALLVALGRPRGVAWLAAALFLLAPQNLEAAYWYAASTDLWATVFVLGALTALARGWRGTSAALALAACASKESALILPALGLVVLGVRGRQADAPAWRQRLAAVVPHLVLAAGVIVIRTRVLGGWGGTGDARAPLPASLFQIAGGLVHVFTGAAVLPAVVAWGLGAAATALIALAAVRRARAGDRAVLAPLAFTAIAAAPVLAAGWAVGARYFYLPAVGLAWAAGEVLASAGTLTRATIAAALLAVGGVQAAGRHAEIASYDRRVAAARRAVGAGVRQGQRVFHVAGGVKDLDLAVKEDPALADAADRILVLADVPASFVVMPPDLEAAAAILIAAPPLPPSGAYHFGAKRIVGLARRGDDPSLDEVVARLPDIRFIRLRPSPGGRVLARDVTDEVERTLD